MVQYTGDNKKQFKGFFILEVYFLITIFSLFFKVIVGLFHHLLGYQKIRPYSLKSSLRVRAFKMTGTQGYFASGFGGLENGRMLLLMIGYLLTDAQAGCY